MDNIKQQIQNTLSLREELIDEVQNEEQLLRLVTIYVQELIDHDFERLLLVLYRLDVGEIKVKKALDINGAANAAQSIAQLIIDREKEKIETRKKYDNQNSDWKF